MLSGKSVNGADAKDCFVRVRKRDLDKLTTEVMQLREFLPKVLNGDLIEMLNKAKAAQTMTAMKEQMAQEQERLMQECAHLQCRLEAAQAECQKEREEKLLLREQLWQSGTELQQQADFCSGLGSATCSLLWSCSSREDTIIVWLADQPKLQPFVVLAAQTLESFVHSLGEDVKVQTEDPNSQEHKFVLAVAGTITNIAAVTNGRDFLASSAHVLLDTLIRSLEMMKPGAFPKLKVLMLMALYNVSISVKGLKYMVKNPGLLSVTWKLLEERDWEVCLHSLRLLQSLVLEDEAVLLLGPAVVDPELVEHVRRLSSSVQPSLRAAAQQTLEDLQALHKSQGSKASKH